MHRRVLPAAILLLAAVGLAGAAGAAESYRLKLSHFLPPVHQYHSDTLVSWAKELEEKSAGRLKLEIFPAQQMGSVAEQYNLARRGDADIAFVLHGIPGGRFPLVELSHLPYLFDSADMATSALMDLLPDYLAKEHKGVKVLYLFAHAPGSIHTRARPVRRLADVAGLRLRHPSGVIGETLAAWGAAPAGMPPSQIAENLDKGVIDGLVMPYDGVFGFRLGKHLKYTTETFSYVTTFALVMNPKSYRRLPADLRKLIDDTTGKAAALRVAAAWTAVERPGKQYLVDNGVEIIALGDGERAAFAKAAAAAAEQRLAETEAKGQPARAFYDRMRALAAKFGN
jgi:TRAP-type C4-dicarboxylate transport system substrate-binding protein